MTPERGWLMIIVGALGLDVWLIVSGRGSLSTAWEGLPRWFTVPFAAYLLGHLFGLFPRGSDPLRHSGRILKVNDND